MYVSTLIIDSKTLKLVALIRDTALYEKKCCHMEERGEDPKLMTSEKTHLLKFLTKI